MTNRYTNLDGARRISETYDQINTGFDKVQEEMDAKETPEGAQEKIDQAKEEAIEAAATALSAHKQRGADEHPAAAANSAGFMSAADKKKSDASTAAPTANTLIQRDAAGRAQVAPPAAAADIARKKEVDDVQNALDTHKQDTIAHLTQAEHTKLTDIEVGAQKNQKAFGSVNGITAETATDSFTIEGATGISVTKDGKKIILTATGQSTPGAHAATHLPGGADPIQLATNEQPGLMSAAQATALAAAESKTDATAKLQAAKDYTDASRLSGTTTNVGNAYALTIANGPTLGKFRKITVEINADSTGAATLAYNGGSALPIRKMTGSGAVAVTNLKAGGIYSLAYSGSAFILQGEGGEYGDASAGDVRAGKKIGSDSGLVTGTLPVRATTSVTANGTLPSGIYDSDLTVAVPDPSIGTTDAVATDLRAGKKMRSGGALVTGTKPVQATAAQTVTTNKTLAAGIYDGAITVAVPDPSIGTTATAADLAAGKTARSNGAQITGTGNVITNTATPGSSVVYANTTFKDSYSLTAEKLYSATVKIPGKYRITSRFQTSIGGYTATFHIRVNGVIVYQTSSTSTVTTDISCDLTSTVNPNDLIEIWGWISNSSAFIRVWNFNLCVNPDNTLYATTTP